MKRSMLVSYLLLGILVSLTSAQHNPNYAANRTTMVHLFEWKWNDIAAECESFLGPYGYAGLQVSPVNENIIVANRPWWERYQSISYKLITRSGTEDEFKSMVNRCNNVGVRIYVDVVFNHVTAISGVGTGGSTSDVANLNYPNIPYNSSHFHADCSIANYSNANEVRNCRLVGLPDLNQGNTHVRSMIMKFMNELIAIGVAGFRIDAAKHMWPVDLVSVYNSLNNLNKTEFPEGGRPFIFQEVIDLGGEAVKKEEYSGSAMGVVTEFRFSNEIGNAFKGNNQLKWLRSWGPEWDFLPSKDAFVFVDNHDNQRSGDGKILTHKSRQQYIKATTFMLAHPYGHPRVMSSFKFNAFDQGPPANVDGEIISPKINPETEQCEENDPWVCEHRWPEIRNMIKFRNVVGNAPVQLWWDNGGNQIAFSRGTRGFVAFNNEQYELNAKLFTALPGGIYCDAITGGMTADGACIGNRVEVDENGEAMIRLDPSIGALAIHIMARIELQPGVIMRY